VLGAGKQSSQRQLVVSDRGLISQLLGDSLRLNGYCAVTFKSRYLQVFTGNDGVVVIYRAINSILLRVLTLRSLYAVFIIFVLLVVIEGFLISIGGLPYVCNGRNRKVLTRLVVVFRLVTRGELCHK